MGLKEIISAEKTKDRAVLLFKNSSVAEVAEGVRSLLDRERYRIEEGTSEDGVYGTGNAIARFMFGGFARRYKFRVQVTPQSQVTRLEFSRAMTGAMGGVIGYNKMSKEFNRLSEALKMIG